MTNAIVMFGVATCNTIGMVHIEEIHQSSAEAARLKATTSTSKNILFGVFFISNPDYLKRDKRGHSVGRDKKTQFSQCFTIHDAFIEKPYAKDRIK